MQSETLEAAVTVQSPGALELAWTFDAEDPECAIHDPQRDEIYLSHMGKHSSTEINGRGSISRVSTDGKLIQARWIDNLRCPTGMCIFGGELYINDADRVLVADAATGKILHEYAAPGVRFFDGMTANRERGEIYCSDIWGNAIWKLSRAAGSLTRWVEDARLRCPDGMTAESGRLVAGSFALHIDDTKAGRHNGPRKGHLLGLDYETGAITDIGDGSPIANHDGLTHDGAGGFITSDFVDGCLVWITADGRVTDTRYIAPTGELCLTSQAKPAEIGCADIRLETGLRTLFVPLLSFGRLAAYRVLG